MSKNDIVSVTVTVKPPGNYYELSSRLGHAVGALKLDDKEWIMSSGAQLSVLQILAHMLGLKQAEAILAPLVADRMMDDAGNLYPDHLTRN